MSSLRALLTGVIDYAGLFPPANLTLARAIHLYARYRQERESWMLGRFICPAERLAELASFVPQLFSPASRLSISVLGSGGRSGPEFLAGVKSDVDSMAAFRDRRGEQTDIDAYEVRTPAEVLGRGSEDVARALVHQAGEIIHAQFPSPAIYYEASSGTAVNSSVSLLSTALADANHLGSEQPTLTHRAGLKLRCGGLEAADFPSSQQVAFTITLCRDTGVPLKFTAGLHHPIRHFNPGVQTHMHGFLNIFTAGVLAHARHLREDQVRQIIEDDDPTHFGFDGAGLRWKDVSASVAQIHAARQAAVISFGSCSFDEPREGLRAMGLLNENDAS